MFISVEIIISASDSVLIDMSRVVRLGILLIFEATDRNYQVTFESMLTSLSGFSSRLSYRHEGKISAIESGKVCSELPCRLTESALSGLN